MDTTIINYYDEKSKEHGAVSKGVDWNGKESQYLRFDVLSNIFKESLVTTKLFCIIDMYTHILSYN